MTLQEAVEEKLRQLEAKIAWHKSQVKLCEANMRYWKNLMKEVSKLTKTST